MQWFLQRLERYGEQPAFQEGETTVTYSALVGKTADFVEQMHAAGIRQGDIVLLLGMNDSSLFAAILAALQMRVIVAPLTYQAPIAVDKAAEIAASKWQVEVVSGVLSVRLRSEQTPPISDLVTELITEDVGGLILFTSGSSGQPKGILYDSVRLLEKFRKERPPIRALSFLLLDHFGGLNTVLTILSSGGEVIGLPDRKPESVCAAVARYQVKVLPVTPSFIRLLFASALHKRFDLSSLEKITFGTEPMTTSALNRLAAEFPGVELQQTYGLSEVGVLRSKSRQDGSLWMKIGGEGFDWKVKNGTLWIRSAFQMRGYLNAVAEFDEDGYFNTQDEILVDGEFIQVLGRVSDVINVGGEKIYPAEIEACVEELPNIRHVVAYSVPNALVGSLIAVDVVVDSDESQTQLKSRIRNQCLNKLGKNKVPSKVRIVNEIQISNRQKTVRKR